MKTAQKLDNCAITVDGLAWIGTITLAIMMTAYIMVGHSISFQRMKTTEQ